MDLGLQGHAALVTAASRGMGRAVAEVLVDEGCEVAVCARGEAALAETARALRDRGGRVADGVADLATSAGAERAVALAVDSLGRLDHLLVNAGGPPPGRFADLDDEAWRRAFELTLMSAVRLVRHALPHLRRSDSASIVIISSYSVKQPIVELLASNSIRLGVIGLAKSLATELAPVRVNTVLPGNISTDRALELAELRAERNRRSRDEELAATAAQCPLGRLGSGAEVARLCAFLLSPAASYITGQVVACDGGLVRFPL